MKTTRISPLAAWALAFGCALGWDSFVLPWTTFLPKAGPLGTVLGILIGAVVMVVVAWNYHCMINQSPGPGGAYAYASKAFGGDHGFLCAWFLCLAYVAILWMDAAVLVIAVRLALGDVLEFGFSLNIAGYEVRLGHILLSTAAIAVSAAMNCRRSVACRAQIAFAAVFVAGIVASFCAALAGHVGGFAMMSPAFAPSCGAPAWQVAQIVAIAPWLFIGFESISQASDEFGFQHRKSFAVMASVLAAVAISYVLLSAIPALVPDARGWSGAVMSLGSDEQSAFAAVGRCLGGAGGAVLGAALVGAIFTNLVGNMFAASRLVAAMADDGAMPRWLGGKGADGSPRNAVAVIACVSVAVASLGQSVVGVIVDTSLVGAAIAYAYTSAATFKASRDAGRRASAASGLCGLVLSVVIILIYVVPNFMSDAPAMMCTESYLVLIVWCIAGLISFLSLFHRDGRRRFGRSIVVWISLLAVILAMSLAWMRQKTYETTKRAFDDIVSRHCASCERLDQGRHHLTPDWQAVLREKLSGVNSSIVRNSLVQGGLIVLSLSLMVCIYAILRRRERELEIEKARAKSYFFSTVSHDIRTPLNAIIGFSEMLNAGSLTEDERKQAIDSIIVSGRTLLGLINDVLDLSKLESGKMEIAPEPTDVPRLVSAVMDVFRVSGGKPGVELRCSVEAMPILMLDPQRIRQIVFNLVGNAVKFTVRGHVELRAAYVRRAGADDGEFRIEVEDTGCGISDEDKARIGAAYVQVGARNSRNGGTGLGLAICGQLAAAMGGRLGIESELGRGSTFSVTIPGVKQAEERPPTNGGREPDDGQQTCGGKRSDADDGPRAGGQGPAPRRLLIVDDSRMNIMVLKALLKHIGDFEISTAGDGLEALAQLKSSGANPFDMVLTDMWMPNLGGDGLVKEIRANPAWASMRVVVATADVEYRGKFAEMGFDDLLLKPITVEKLAKVVSGRALP